MTVLSSNHHQSVEKARSQVSLVTKIGCIGALIEWESQFIEDLIDEGSNCQVSMRGHAD